MPSHNELIHQHDETRIELAAAAACSVCLLACAVYTDGQVTLSSKVDLSICHWHNCQLWLEGLRRFNPTALNLVI